MTGAKNKPLITSLSFNSLLLVLIVHAGLLYAMWHHRFPQPSLQTVTLFAELISPPQKVEPANPTKVDLKAEPKPTPPEKPKVTKKIQPQQQVAALAPAKPKDVTIPLPVVNEPIKETDSSPPQEVKPAVASRPQLSADPVTLSSELSVSCPELSAPDYPAISRRLGEEGKLMLQVELDESGKISNTRIINSSGYSRLDNAALAAVKTWRCRPAVRDGQPVKAIALQPFNFVIQGN